jgi:hypothetical protein
MCQTTAWRQLTAARICRAYPRNFERIARGELHVSVLAELNRYLNETNAEELLASCVGKSFREVQLMIAERFPKPDLRDSVRREGASTESVDDSKETTADSATTSDVGSADGTIGSSGPPSKLIEPLAADRFAVRFTADGDFVALLERVQGLASHRGSTDLLTVLKAGLASYERELLKQRFGVGRKPKGKGKAKTEATPASGGPANETAAVRPQPRKRRHVPVDVARTVYERDGGQCTFVAPSGRRCKARRKLQLDHIVPDALDGGEAVENLRIRCETHNQMSARDFFGKDYMEAVMKRVAVRPRGKPVKARPAAEHDRQKRKDRSRG